MVLGDGAPAVAEAPASSGLPARRRFTIVWGAAFLNRPRPQYRVEGLLLRNTLVGLVGPFGSYKSYVALDLALSAASGRPWLGREVAQCPALFISGEGSGGLTDRGRAWALHRGEPFPEAFGMLPEAVQFLQTGDVTALLEEVRALPVPPGLIVVDTLARTMVGGDENSARDMGVYVDGVDQLRQATGATVVVVHHVTKATNKIRGSTALPGALDTIIEVHADGPEDRRTLRLACGKQKDAPPFKTVTLAPTVVQVEDGITNIVFDVTEGVLVGGTHTTGSAALALSLLGGQFGPDGATYTQWKVACKRSGISPSSFDRARDTLVREGQVVQSGGSYIHAFHHHQTTPNGGGGTFPNQPPPPPHSEGVGVKVVGPEVDADVSLFDDGERALRGAGDPPPTGARTSATGHRDLRAVSQGLAPMALTGRTVNETAQYIGDLVSRLN